jgi:hypothetical protein
VRPWIPERLDARHSTAARTINDDGSGNFIDALSNVKLSSVTGVFVAAGSDNQLTLSSPALNRAEDRHRRPQPAAGSVARRRRV